MFEFFPKCQNSISDCKKATLKRDLSPMKPPQCSEWLSSACGLKIWALKKIHIFCWNRHFFILVHGLSEVISAWSDISASKGDIEILVDKSLHLVVFSMPLHWWSHARILGGAYSFRMWLIFHIFSSTKNAYLLMRTFFTENHSRITICCSGRFNYLSRVPGNLLFCHLRPFWTNIWHFQNFEIFLGNAG